MTQGPIHEDDIVWVRWNANAAAAHPELKEAVARFDPGPMAAAQASATWLREAGLSGESVPYLATVDGEVVGFYALTAGEVELATSDQKRVGVSRPTQGAYLVTQLAKSAHHDFDGGLLVQDALGTASELADGASATVLALDPFDEATSTMWRSRFQMRRSRTRYRGADGEDLRRLFLPLRQP